MPGLLFKALLGFARQESQVVFENAANKGLTLTLKQVTSHGFCFIEVFL